MNTNTNAAAHKNMNANRYAEIFASNVVLSVVVERGTANGPSTVDGYRYAVRNVVAAFANAEQAAEYAAETSKAWRRRLDVVRVVSAGRKTSAHDMTAAEFLALGFGAAQIAG